MADIITIENNIKKYLKDGIDKENFFSMILYLITTFL